MVLVCADASEAARTHDITKHAVRMDILFVVSGFSRTVSL